MIFINVHQHCPYGVQELTTFLCRSDSKYFRFNRPWYIHRNYSNQPWSGIIHRWCQYIKWVLLCFSKILFKNKTKHNNSMWAGFSQRASLLTPGLDNHSVIRLTLRFSEWYVSGLVQELYISSCIEKTSLWKNYYSLYAFFN